jgi:hypothetical protein
MAAFAVIVHSTLAGVLAVFAAVVARRGPRTLAPRVQALILEFKIFHTSNL